MTYKLPTIPFLLALFLLFFVPLSSVSAGFGFIKNSQPVFSPDQTNWDSVQVLDSFLINQGNSYGMWYAGHGTYNGGTSDHWKLGYAQMDKSTNAWTRNASILLFQGLSDLQEAESSDPFIIKENDNSYKIWYDAYNPPQSGIRYATSTDGQTWTKYSSAVLTGTQGKFDSAGLARGKSVIYDGTDYRMWYTGSSGGGKWAIGYATSPDGVSWTKQNNGNPIIVKTETWEYDNLSYPYVFFAYGKYHMFYATGPGDLPTRIVYANSLDGINWNKPSDLNPVFDRNSYLWESQSIASPFILIEDNKLKLWYSAYGVMNPQNLNDWRWQIGYAEAPLSNLPGVTPETKKIFIVPGFGGSWNTEALLNCRLNETNPESWTITPYIGYDVYQPLFDTLNSSGKIAFYFPYDWRWGITHTAPVLANKLASSTLDAEKVDLIGHSLGGLLGKSYLDQTTDETNKIRNFIAVGTPFQGAVGAYPAWSAGEVWNDNMLARIGMTTIINVCGKLRAKTNRDVVRDLIPSIGNLLPRFPYLTDVKTQETRSAADADNTWPLAPIANSFKGSRIKTVSGTGFSTLSGLDVKDPTNGDRKYNNWLDGKPQKTETSTAGDGTVLSLASRLANVDNTEITATHSGLVNSPTGMQTIFSLLGIPWQNSAAQPSEIKSALTVIAYPATSTMTDPSQAVRKDIQNMIGFSNPKRGSYRLAVVPKSDTTRVYVGQFLENGRNLWKEYSFNGKLPFSKTLIFDPENPTEDALQ